MTDVQRILALKRRCPDHPMPLPKPSCPVCARNGGIEAAARVLTTPQPEETPHGND